MSGWWQARARRRGRKPGSGVARWRTAKLRVESGWSWGRSADRSGRWPGRNVGRQSAACGARDCWQAARCGRRGRGIATEIARQAASLWSNTAGSISDEAGACIRSDSRICADASRNSLSTDSRDNRRHVIEKCPLVFIGPRRRLFIYKILIGLNGIVVVVPIIERHHLPANRIRLPRNKCGRRSSCVNLRHFISPVS